VKHIKLYILVIVGVLASNALADEKPIPQFKKSPDHYKACYGGELLVGDKTKQEITFWVNTEGANGHQCYATGKAHFGTGLEYRYSDDTGCMLDLIFVEHSVVLIDQARICQKTFCGTRASLNGAVFTLTH
jgi:hypothetical protein